MIGIRGILFSSILVMMAERTQACEIKPLFQMPNYFGRAYFDQFATEDRDQVLQFSTHTGTSHQYALYDLYYEVRSMNGWFGKRHKDSVAKTLRALLETHKDEVRLLRVSANQQLQLHQRKPFQYLGIEMHAYGITRVDELIQIANESRRLLKTKMGGRLTTAEIEDVFLYLLGDELYLKLKGKEFESLPIVPTEDEELHSQFADALMLCELSLNEMSFLVNDSNNEILKESFQDLDETLLASFGPESLARYGTALSGLIRAAGDEFDLSFKDRLLLRTAFSPCSGVFSEERDRYLADAMVSRLPKGRGLIYRGTNHREPLHRFLEQQCAGKDSGHSDGHRVNGAGSAVQEGGQN